MRDCFTVMGRSHNRDWVRDDMAGDCCSFGLQSQGLLHKLQKYSSGFLSARIMSIFSLRRSSRCHSNSASILPFCLVVELQLQLRIYVIVLAIQQWLLLWRLGVLCQFVAALTPCSLSNSFPEELSLPSLHHRLVLCRCSLLERAQLACLSPFYSRNMVSIFRTLIFSPT